ncbi:MAG: HTH-type transcriptional repressor CytR [Smithella sp. PtaU1.Bin162]|nr:MAG: HTH-type transcriptional repressor CytR [Smithella sp. PtaU1.Bin162]
MTTIKEIAKRANVSYSTVSRALNNKKGVRAEIRERVNKIANEINYFPHSSAKALVKKRVGVLGIIMTRTGEFAFQNPYYSQILMGISDVATNSGYHLMLSINEKKSYVDLFLRRMVDGILVIGNRLDDELLPDLAKKGVVAVVIPGLLEGAKIDIPSVNSENYQSVYRAVAYLLDLGHRKIAFILGMMNSKYSVERFQAYQAAFRDHGLSYDPRYIVESDFSKTDGFRMMGRLLDLQDRPSCVICINDSVTPGALKQINGRGLKIPEDISVVAIGSSEVLDLYEPALTTIKISVTEIGQTAAQMLIQLIEKGNCPEKHVVIPSEFIIRDSTRAWQYTRETRT